MAKTRLEMYATPNGNYAVLLNGQHVANLVDSGLWHTGERTPGWHIISLTAGRRNGRKRYNQPQDAIRAYFKRLAIVIPIPRDKISTPRCYCIMPDPGRGKKCKQCGKKIYPTFRG
jgi:hypothetical protein